MRMETEPLSGTTRRSAAPWLIVAGLFFLLGVVAAAWVIARSPAAAGWLGIRPTPVRVPVRVPVPVPLGAATANAADPVLGRRLAMIEQRLGQIDQASRAAGGNVGRAEGLLIAFAARRALDRGVGLGYLEGLLRERFGAGNRQAVATVLTAARQPVTLEDLRQGLQEIGPELTGAGPNQDWWRALKAELGGLVIVRREGTPSTLPAERLERAAQRLDAGQVDVALAEVLRLPGRDNGRAWIAEARRYVAARRALDQIEAAALLEPQVPAITVPVAPPPPAG